MTEILRLLEKNAKMTASEIADVTGLTIDEVKKAIEVHEKNKTIVGYSAVVNWDKTENEFVTALIEVKVAPQSERGFDKIAEKIYKYQQVKSCYLMSGSFDLSVIVEGKDIKEVALFISEKLSTIEGIAGVATYFVLKKYKDKNMMFGAGGKDDREAIVL